MPATQPEPVAGDPSRTTEAGALFQLLISRKGDPKQVYTAMREVSSLWQNPRGVRRAMHPG